MNTITLSSAGQHWTVSPGFADGKDRDDLNDQEWVVRNVWNN